MANSQPSNMNLLDLPDCMIEQVLMWLSYDDISKQRMVCQRFNTLSKGLLNIGFHKMMKRHGHLMKMIKSQLPRRESERRSHSLSKHSELLTCVENRVSYLHMSYSKYIDANLCCFIPGKVIDEVTNVLNLITHRRPTKETGIFNMANIPLRIPEMLQELRDISSMAIEHFEEHIVPALKKAYRELPPRILSVFNCNLSDIPNKPYRSLLNSSTLSPFTQQSSSSTPIKAPAKRLVDKHQINYVRLERKFKTAMRKLNSVISIQNRQSQKLRLYSNQITDLNAQVADLQQRLDATNSTANKSPLSATITSRTELPTVRSVHSHKMPKMSAPIIDLKQRLNNIKAESESLSHISSMINVRTTRSSRNIKPRSATIILKRIAEPTADSTTNKKTKFQNIL